MTRLDFDLRDAVAHLGRDGVPDAFCLALERLRKQAHGRERRAELVRQVVDEFGADALQPAELGDILEDQPEAAVGQRRSSAHGDDGAVRTGGP